MSDHPSQAQSNATAHQLLDLRLDQLCKELKTDRDQASLDRSQMALMVAQIHERDTQALERWHEAQQARQELKASVEMLAEQFVSARETLERQLERQEATCVAQTAAEGKAREKLKEDLETKLSESMAQEALKSRRFEAALLTLQAVVGAWIGLVP